MAKIDKLLVEWNFKKLLSDEQVILIQKYESTKQESSWILTSLLILGAVIIGIGIISVIAANWYEIPDPVKLSIDFSLMLATGYFLFHNWSKNEVTFFEATLVFYQVLCVASIGLIAQVYNTGGKTYQALLIWSFITLLFTLFSKKTFAPMIWAAVTFSALEMYFHQFTDQLTNHAFSSSMLVTTLILVGITLTLIYLPRFSNLANAFRPVAVLFSLVAIVTAEISNDHYRTNEVFNINILHYFSYILGSLTLSALWLANFKSKIQNILLSTSLFFFILIFNIPFLKLNLNLEFILACNAILILAPYCLYLASTKQRFLFQFFAVLIGIRFLVLYFQALGGLATTGFGLILSGILVIGATVSWNKHKNKIAAWAERIST